MFAKFFKVVREERIDYMWRQMNRYVDKLDRELRQRMFGRLSPKEVKKNQARIAELEERIRSITKALRISEAVPYLPQRRRRGWWDDDPRARAPAWVHRIHST